MSFSITRSNCFQTGFLNTPYDCYWFDKPLVTPLVESMQRCFAMLKQTAMFTWHHSVTIFRELIIDKMTHFSFNGWLIKWDYIESCRFCTRAESETLEIDFTQACFMRLQIPCALSHCCYSKCVRSDHAPNSANVCLKNIRLNAFWCQMKSDPLGPWGVPVMPIKKPFVLQLTVRAPIAVCWLCMLSNTVC